MKSTSRFLFPVKIAFVVCFIGSWAAAQEREGSQAASARTEQIVRYGAPTIDSQGRLIRNGAIYRAVGVNYFDAFCRTFRTPGDDTYREGFKQLADNDIPFARFAASGTWPEDFKLYLADKEAYFRLLDSVISAAEEYNVGLFPSLFWSNIAIPDLVGESRDQWGNPASKTRQFMRTYTREVVSRYQKSPAIWGWEFGCEFPLALDYPDPQKHLPRIVPGRGTARVRTERDYLHFDMFKDAILDFAKTVRSIDSTRMLLTGNALPRPAAYHNYKERNSTHDTLSQFGAMLLRDNPDPFSPICIHTSPADSIRYFSDRKVDFEELLRTCVSISHSVRKPLDLEEFSIIRRPSTAGNAVPTEEEFAAALKAIDASGVTLASIWVYDRKSDPKNVTFNNQYAYMLKMIGALNRKWLSQSQTQRAGN